MGKEHEVPSLLAVTIMSVLTSLQVARKTRHRTREFCSLGCKTILMEDGFSYSCIIFLIGSVWIGEVKLALKKILSHFWYVFCELCV